MESDIIDKFPSGGIWWRVQHRNCDTWQQKSYDKPSEHVFSFKIKTKQNGTEDTYTHNNHNGNISHDSSRLKQRHEGGRQRNTMISICDAILNEIDPCATLYTNSQKIDASTWLRQRLFNFVSSDAYTYLGPKKSRILSSWLSGNPCKPDTESIISDFLSFLLGADKVHAWKLHNDRRGQWWIIQSS